MKYDISKLSLEYVPFRQGGAPSKYHPEMCNIVIEVAKEEGFHAAMCVALGITEKTFNVYRKDHPEFNDAVEYADLITLAQQEKRLQDGAAGRIEKYNFNANAMVLNNKYRHSYDRSGSGNNTEITINAINLTPEQINYKIAQKLEKLKSLGIELQPAVIEHETIEVEEDEE